MNTDTIVPNESATRVPPEYAPAAPLPDTFREWLIDHLSEELPDVARGVDGGWYGLTYYEDTCALYAKYRDEIWARIREECETYDLTPLGFIASFGGAKNADDPRTFQNLLVWYMAESLAREIVEARENSDDAE